MSDVCRTLDLVEAAAFLRMSPAVLRQKAKAGVVRGAKPGKRWVFLVEDLAAYLRSLYHDNGQAPQSGWKEVIPCHSINAAMCGGSALRHQTDDEYANLLRLKISNRPRNTTTG
ncbi:MAG: helix-turn-helix domain-containing protein [Gammaproteobacteria bacterium]|nr:helix-turn-helix domain-containing protein [Gammaproteobacteria bacterium]